MHKQFSELYEKCPIRDVLDRLGDRWTMLILMELSQSTLRFGSLKKKIPDISPRMLAQTLRQLEQDGLIKRDVFATIPPRVDYTMTPLGQSFFTSLKDMIQWANDYHSEVKAARAQYNAQNEESSGIDDSSAAA